MSQALSDPAFIPAARKPNLRAPYRARTSSLDTPISGAIVAAALAVVLAAIPFLLRHRAYYHDDMQSQYIPALVAIGRSLAEGHWPSLTLQLGLGGALVGEYQYGLFNPVEMLKMLVLGRFSDMESAAAFLGIADYAILGAAVFLLARRLGANSAYALLASSTFVCNNFVFYWLAVSWRPGVSSMGYVLLACTFLLDAARTRTAFVASVACAFLTMTAGWPQGILALGLFGLFQIVGDLQRHRQRAALTRIGALGCAALLAAPAVLPLLAMGAYDARADGIFNEGMFQPNLYSLLAFSSPFQFGQIKSFMEYVTVSVPIFYAAWFILPCLAFLDLKKAGKTAYIKPMLLGAAILLIVTQGPQQFLPLRFPFRFIAYFHALVLIMFAVIATRAGVAMTRPRVSIALLIITFQAIVALQMQPAYGPLIVPGMLVCAIAIYVAAKDPSRLGPGSPIVLGGIGVALFIGTHALFPTNRDLPDWGARARVDHVSQLRAIPQRYTAVVGQPHDNIAPSQAQPFANMPLLRGEATTFGYSPIGFDRLALTFNNMTHGPARMDSLRAHLQPSEHGATPFVDLAKIDKLVLLQPLTGSVAQTTAAGFACDPGGLDAWVCTRPFRPRFDGSLAYAPRDVALRALPSGSATEETFSAENRSGAAATLVFNRIGWPGYGVSLNGTPLPIDRDRFGLLTTQLPAGKSGTLEVSYTPAGLTTGLFAAMLGALVALALCAWGRLWPRHCLAIGKAPVLRASFATAMKRKPVA